MYPTPASTAPTEGPAVENLSIDLPIEDVLVTPGRIEAWTRRVFLLAILLTCGLCFSLTTAEPDLWGHVQYGRDLLRDGLPRTTTYSYTAEGYPWINHENLAELVLAWGVGHFGVLGLTFGKFALGLGILTLVLVAARRAQLTLMGVAVTTLLVAANLTYYWQPRPRLLSYALFAVLMALVTWCFHGWQGQTHFGRKSRGSGSLSLSWSRMAWLGLAPLIFLVWANTHGGFVAGLCLFSTYLALRSLEAAWVGGRKATAWITFWGLLVVTCWAITLINPYGWHLHAWLWKSLGQPRPEIVEWHGAAWGNEGFLPLGALVGLVLVGFWRSRRGLDATHALLLMLTLWQSVSHYRFVPFFAILAGFWMPVHWKTLFVRSEKETEPASVWLLAGVTSACLALSFLLASRLTRLDVDVADYPVSAIYYMAEQDLGGRLVVTYNWAQYAIAALGASDRQRPPVSVAFDGRFRTCYPQQIVDEHFDFVLGTGPHVPRYRGSESLPPDPGRVLRRGTPNLVLISRQQEPSVHVMQQNRDNWTLLYQDSIAQLWGRRTVYDDPGKPTYLPPSARQTKAPVQQGVVRWPAFPSRETEKRIWVNSSSRQSKECSHVVWFLAIRRNVAGASSPSTAAGSHSHASDAHAVRSSRARRSLAAVGSQTSIATDWQN